MCEKCDENKQGCNLTLKECMFSVVSDKERNELLSRFNFYRVSPKTYVGSNWFSFKCKESSHIFRCSHTKDGGINIHQIYYPPSTMSREELLDILRSKESDNVKISILSDIIRNRTCSECGNQLISSAGMLLDHVNYFPDTDTITCGSCIPPRKKVYCIDCFYFSKSHNPHNIDESKCSAVAEKIVPESASSRDPA